MTDKTQRVEKKILPNGLTIYHEFDNSVDGVFVGAVIHAGSKHEQKPGLAHFLEHVIVSNPIGVEKKSLNYNFIPRSLFIGANTKTLTTCYRFFTPSDPLVFGETLRLIYSALFNTPLLNESYVEVERSAIFEEMIISGINGLRPVFKNVFEVLFPDSWVLKNPGVAGTIEDVQDIVFNDLVQFRQKLYTPQHATLVVYGNMSLQNVCKHIESGNTVLPSHQMPSKTLPQEDTLVYTPLDQMHFVSKSRPIADIENGYSYGIKFVWAIPRKTAKDLFLLRFLCRWINTAVRTHVFDCFGQKSVYAVVTDNEYIDHDMHTLSISIPLFSWTKENQASTFLNELFGGTVMDNVFDAVYDSFEHTIQRMVTSSYGVGSMMMGLVAEGAQPLSFASYTAQFHHVSKADVQAVLDTYVQEDNVCVYIS